MNEHISTQEPHIGDEPMIDAKQAAAALRLPYYWFADPGMRARYRIPHYLLSRLVRFRLSELSAWAAQNGTVRRRGGAPEKPCVGGES